MDVDPLFFDPRARNAEKAAARLRDAERVASGEITAEQLAHENAFIPYSVDLSRWVVVFDSFKANAYLLAAAPELWRL